MTKIGLVEPYQSISLPPPMESNLFFLTSNDVIYFGLVRGFSLYTLIISQLQKCHHFIPDFQYYSPYFLITDQLSFLDVRFSRLRLLPISRWHFTDSGGTEDKTTSNRYLCNSMKYAIVFILFVLFR